ncbi:MAG TPA: ABC transporter permease [Candidatus Acidoferrales bacterium]|jgi:ABC-2 type transport system permease protein|nr:ABC transporter permease [Candidatus Acidoferrales bacterium]
MRRIIAQARKELIQLLRDRLAVALALFLPVVLLLLQTTAISLTVKDLPIIVQDLDQSQASQKLVDTFRQSLSFHVTSWPADREPEEAFASNSARGALIIPEEYGREIARGENATVQILVDASDENTAQIISGDAAQIVRAYNAENAGARQVQPVNAAIRLWYNPSRSSQKFYGPGIYVLAMSLFPPLLATLAMSKEGEQKTILQVYVSNISAHEFLLGKIAAFMLVATAEAIVLMMLLFMGFGLRFAGDPTPFLVSTILYMFVVTTFGNMIGAAIPSQVAAMQAVALTGFLLVYMLSGLLFPVENIPAGIRWISNIVWGRYYIEIVRDSLLAGGGWPSVWSKVLAIAAIGAIFYTIAWRNLRHMQLKD